MASEKAFILVETQKGVKNSREVMVAVPGSKASIMKVKFFMEGQFGNDFTYTIKPLKRAS